MSLNCHYLVLFKSPRDSSQVNHLAKQMFPGHVKYMQEAVQDATKRHYGYLLCDLKRETPSDFRLRSRSQPQRNRSVEHGPASEKESRLFEATGKVYTHSV